MKNAGGFRGTPGNSGGFRGNRLFTHFDLVKMEVGGQFFKKPGTGMPKIEVGMGGWGHFFQKTRYAQEVNTGFCPGFGESGYTEGWGDLKDSQKLSKHRKI
jgi:hypothetical protein